MMMKRSLLGGALAAAVLVSPVPAFAQQGDPVYNTRYFSDATYTVEVGFDPGTCNYWGVGSGHTGQATNYIQYQLVGYCDHGNWEPL